MTTSPPVTPAPTGASASSSPRADSRRPTRNASPTGSRRRAMTGGTTSPVAGAGILKPTVASLCQISSTFTPPSRVICPSIVVAACSSPWPSCRTAGELPVIGGPP